MTNDCNSFNFSLIVGIHENGQLVTNVRSITEFRFILAIKNRMAVLTVDLDMARSSIFHRLYMSRRRGDFPPITDSHSERMNLRDISRPFYA